jgi:hypothetical protein
VQVGEFLLTPTNDDSVGNGNGSEFNFPKVANKGSCDNIHAV